MLMEKNDIYDEFNHFLQESNKILVEVCLRFTDRQPDNVRDLYQDIALSLWESWPSFRGESSRTTWVYRIAVNTATSALRRQAAERQFVAIDQQMLESLAEEVKDEQPEDKPDF
jgi:RNA polymerase sigma-70 factor (ECF subfamily)